MNRPELMAYDYRLHEALLLQAYGRMRESGELARIFDDSLHPLSDFMHFFGHDIAVVFAENPQPEGIWFLAWIRNFRKRIADLSVWVSPEHRHSKACLFAMETVLDRTLKLYASVIGFTTTDLIPLHAKLGYSHVGTIPSGIEVVALTQQAFKPRLLGSEDTWARQSDLG